MDTFDTQTDNGEERFHESEEPTQMIKGIRNMASWFGHLISLLC